jgi:hypothetical protein
MVEVYCWSGLSFLACLAHAVCAETKAFSFLEFKAGVQKILGRLWNGDSGLASTDFPDLSMNIDCTKLTCCASSKTTNVMIFSLWRPKRYVRLVGDSLGYYHPSVTVSPTIPGDLRSIPVDQRCTFRVLRGDRSYVKGTHVTIKVWIPFLTGACCKFWVTYTRQRLLRDLTLFGVAMGCLENSESSGVDLNYLWYSWYSGCKWEIEIKFKNLSTQKAFKSGGLSLSPWR